MLARLEADPGIERAESDVHGELLRLQLRGPGELAAALALLESLGFAAALAEGETVEREWFGPERVGELSRAEGRVIAQRVVPIFARENALDMPTTAALVDAVASALHRCFVSHELEADLPPAVLRESCARAAKTAAEPLLGSQAAAALGALIAADLASRSTGGSDR